MSIKLIDFMNIMSFNEKVEIYDKNNHVLFLGNKNHILSLLQKKQVIATKTIAGFMIYNNVISININYEK